MRALRSFTVRSRLPEALTALGRLAANLRWSWDERTRDVFRWVDPDGWDATRHDPAALIAQVPRERLEALARDQGFRRYLAEVDDELTRYLHAPRWFQSRTSPLSGVAYFSPEFGITEALPQYSGGLGVLAGDHLKAASDLGVPILGVGLFYRHGYFRQSLSPDGWQQERFPDQDPYTMALTPCDGVRVSVDLAGTTLHARVWRADVGRTPLYLLDSDVDDNDHATRQVTDRLYGGDVEHRLRQEILLGIGGVRALEALGHDVQVFHTNEGHAGFLGLERIRRFVTRDGLGFEAAVEAARAGTIFTTHTPVPAGIDRFPRELITRYFSGWAAECGVGIDQLMALGHRPDDGDDRFNMAVMGLRLAGRSNAVAKLHGRVSRSMFAALWPDLEQGEVPIGSVTNGVHGPSWVSPEMSDLYARHVLPTWAEAGEDDWRRIESVHDDELWRAHEQGRQRLVGVVRERLRHSLMAQGQPAAAVAWCDEVLDPGILTIGFARRFATYKRATLLLAQPERLAALLTSSTRPVQFVFAGKAHPADDQGKDMIRRILQFSADPALRARFVFVDDYDIALARALYHGCDVWLNTPRRPLEACGTSGMKAAANGGLNCSILDGWWDEWFDGTNGWSVTSFEHEPDLHRRDELEANSLFELLERQLVPLFYERGPGGIPRGWVGQMKSSLRTLGPRVLAARMVRDYVEQYYEPAASHAQHMGIDNHARAVDLAGWKRRVVAGWAAVRVLDATADGGSNDLGSLRPVDAEVELGPLQPTDVTVQLLHGPVGQGEELAAAHVVTMAHVATAAGVSRFTGAFTLDTAGRYGFTVRVMPSHPELASPVEMGRVAWA